VGGEDHGGSGRRPFPYQDLERLLVARVQAREGFVQDQEFRIVDQGADQGHLLGHALGQPANLGVERRAQSEALQEAAGLLAGGAGGDPLEGAEEGGGLEGRHPRMQAALLRQEADPVAHAAAVRSAQHGQTA